MKQRTVLVLEDEPVLRNAISAFLGEDGWSVVEAESAEEAIERICDSQRLDALFTDIRVPGGMNGWAIAEVFRAHFPRGTVIYATGISSTHAPVSGSMFFRKPYKLQQVALCLSALIASVDAPV